MSKPDFNNYSKISEHANNSALHFYKLRLDTVNINVSWKLTSII